MRYFLTLLTLPLLWSCASPQAKAPIATEKLDASVYAIIGQKVSKTMELPLETVIEPVIENGVRRLVEREVIKRPDDFLRMVATYNVVRSFDDKQLPETITFKAHNYWGTYSFYNYEYALLILDKTEDGYVLRDFQNDSVFKTADGRWATCGDSTLGAPPDTHPEVTLQAIEFSPELEFELNDPPPISVPMQLNAQERTAYWTSSFFKPSGDNMKCTKGVYAEDLYRLRLSKFSPAPAD